MPRQQPITVCDFTGSNLCHNYIYIYIYIYIINYDNIEYRDNFLDVTVIVIWFFQYRPTLVGTIILINMQPCCCQRMMKQQDWTTMLHQSWTWFCSMFVSLMSPKKSKYSSTTPSRRLLAPAWPARNCWPLTAVPPY